MSELISPSRPSSPALHPPRESRRHWILFTAILVLAAGLRFSGLGQESLWVDEVHSLLKARAGSPVAVWEALRDDVHPPVYFWLLGSWLQIAPPTETGARLLSALVGIATVAALYFLGRALRLPRAACLFGTALLAISPHAIYYSQEVRMYALETLLGTVHLAFTACMLFPRRRRSPADTVETRPNRRRFVSPSLAARILWLVTGVLLPWTHFFGVFFLAADGIIASVATWRVLRVKNRIRERRPGLAASLRPWRALVGMSVGLALCVLGFVPFLAVVAERLSSGQGIRWLSLVYTMSWRTPGEVAQALICGPQVQFAPMWLEAVAIVGFLGLMVAGVSRLGLGNRHTRAVSGAISGATLRRWLPLLIAIALVGIPTGVSLWKLIILGGQRYLTIAVPSMCLAAGVGLYRGMSSRHRGYRIAAILALAGVVAAQALYLKGYYAGREKRMWREAVAFVAANAQPDDAVATLPSYSLGIVEHYGPGTARPESLEAIISGATPPTRRVWVLSVTPDGTPEEQQLVNLGWRPGLNQVLSQNWLSTLIRVTRFDRGEAHAP